MEIVAADIGGTHTRFAIADIAEGRAIAVGPETVLKTADYPTLEAAWQAYARQAARPLPRAIGLAIAAPVGGETVMMTNNSWHIRPAEICARLDVDRYAIVNDFAAVAHAVATVGPSELQHLCGPDRALPTHGVITVVGPGTGLGVAILHRTNTGEQAIATEGGHIDFAPLDPFDDAVLAALRERHERVSIERIVSGSGLAHLYATLAHTNARAVKATDDRQLWALALSGEDSLAAAALDRFCMTLGSVAGDLALAHGANAVVIAGGLGLRLADHLRRPGFVERFRAKGRYEGRMAELPVKLITYKQPGLLGAAAAFAVEHGEQSG